MHPIRTILAVIFGGFAALLLAQPLVDVLRPAYPALAGLYAFALAPFIAGGLVALVLALADRRAETYDYTGTCGELAQHVHLSGRGVGALIARAQAASLPLGDLGGSRLD